MRIRKPVLSLLAAALLAAGTASAQSRGGARPTFREPVCPGVENGLFGVMYSSSEETADETRAFLAGAVGDSAARQIPVLRGDSAGMELKNRREVARTLARIYPRDAERAGRGAKVLIILRVDENGDVGRAYVGRSSGEVAFDEAAVQVTQKMRFSPAVHEGCRLPVLFRLPITFSLEGYGVETH